MLACHVPLLLFTSTVFPFVRVFVAFKPTVESSFFSSFTRLMVCLHYGTPRPRQIAIWIEMRYIEFYEAVYTAARQYQ